VKGHAKGRSGGRAGDGSVRAGLPGGRRLCPGAEVPGAGVPGQAVSQVRTLRPAIRAVAVTVQITAAFLAVSPLRDPPAFFLVTTGPRIWRSAALLSSDSVGQSWCAMSPHHSRSRAASAFFAGSCRPGACICFFRALSITVIAVSRASCAFSSRAAAASFSRVRPVRQLLRVRVAGPDEMPSHVSPAKRLTRPSAFFPADSPTM
jgi:hypothetical protein